MLLKKKMSRFSEAPVPVPAWFCGFVEAVAGKRLNARRDAEPVSRESMLRSDLIAASGLLQAMGFGQVTEIL